MNWLGLTLTRKFTILLVGFLILQVIQLGTSIFGVLRLGQESAFINEAGKQRMRTFLVANLARQSMMSGLSKGKSVSAFQSMIAEYDAYFTLMEERLKPENIFDEFIEAQRTPALAVLAEAQDAWKIELKPLLANIDLSRPQAIAALEKYEALAPLQAARIDRALDFLENDVQVFSKHLAYMHVTVLVLSLLLAIIGMIMARYVVILPLHRLIEATRSIAAGAYDRRVTVSSHDEIGELAGTFNRMAQAVGDKTSRVEALNEVAVQITSVQPLRELLDEIMRRGMLLTGAQATCIAFYHEESRRFDEWITQGLSDHFIKNMSFRSSGLADETFSAATHVLSNDRPETRHKLSRLTHEEGIQSFVCMPLTSHANRMGVVYFYRKDRDYFLSDEVEILTTFAHLAAGAIENARLHERTQDLAVTDKLTGLRNRRLFDDRLAEEIQRAARYAKPLSLLLFDIDDFKRVNDTYGHPAGDLVLQSLGQFFPGQLRQVDLAARYGGEEFTIILPETDFVGAKLVAERIRRSVAKSPIKLPDGREISLTVSVGVACFPVCGDTVRTIIEHADQALYTAKQEGKNRVCLYREILKTQLELEPNRIVELLNQSLENIQPIVTAISAKAAFFHNHTLLVEQTVKRLADALELSPENREMLRLAALLHDIGMVIVPDAVLSKQDVLTAEDWTLIRNHSATGAGFLEKVPALRHLAPIVRHHHERYDGGGYPDGLKGEAISYLARILTVADTYASMVAEWVGHKARPSAEAKAQLAAAAGTQLDPQIVSAFVKYLNQDRAAPA